MNLKISKIVALLLLCVSLSSCLFVESRVKSDLPREEHFFSYSVKERTWVCEICGYIAGRHNEK